MSNIQTQKHFGVTSDMTYAEALQHRGRSRRNTLRPFTKDDYKTQEELMQAVQDKAKMIQQVEGKPYWLQAREIMKQWQNELVVTRPVKKPPTEQVRFENYVSVLEAVENAKDRRLDQSMQQKSLAEIARMRAKFSYYQRIWIKLIWDAESKENPKSRTRFLYFRDVPWPLFGHPESEEMFPQGRQEILSFILHPDRIGIDKSHSEALEEARRLWDCDGIYDRLLSRVVPQDLQHVSIAYRKVWKAIGGLESMMIKKPKTPTSPWFQADTENLKK